MALVIERTCSVWKNGLYWQQSGIKTVVDIIDQRTPVLLMQCRHGRELKLLTHRSMIMCMVHEAQKEFSSKSKVMEYFLHPHSVKHPLISIFPSIAISCSPFHKLSIALSTGINISPMMLTMKLIFENYCYLSHTLNYVLMPLRNCLMKKCFMSMLMTPCCP